MTTTTPETIAIGVEPLRRPSSRLRFAVAFLIGLMLALAVGVGAMYAYDQQYLGRVLPGVSAGAVDLSGLDPTTAADRLRAEYASLSEGEVVLIGPEGEHSIPFESFGRRVDVDAMVADAMAIGRDGNPVERVIADARTALRGATIEPRVTYDPDALAAQISDYAASLAKRPKNAAVVRPEEGAFQLVPGAAGREADATVPISTTLAAIGDLDAPARIEVPVPVSAVLPAVTTIEAHLAQSQAERIAARLYLDIDGVKGDKPYISATKLRTWVKFTATADGGLVPSIDTTELAATVKKLAKKIDKPAVNASFKTNGGKITGVTPSKAGYKLDQDATVSKIETMLASRAAGAATATVEPSLKVTNPVLTTAEAKAARPKMRKISSWTTYFPITEKNGFGANIWIPARLIDGYVVAPRATFDFWDAVGPVTRARGYRQGGAIINGRTEPQGALAGGICSCSTTLFNAALRAGYEMGARRNHYYYIDRYPLGLDATVFISGSGVQADDVVHQRHQLPGPHPRLPDPGRQRGLRQVRDLQRADRPEGLVQPADREERPPRDRHDPAHVVAAAGPVEAHRVPGRRQAGLGDAHGPRSQGQRDPQGSVLLQLPAHHGRHPGRTRRRLTDPSRAEPRHGARYGIVSTSNRGARAPWSDDTTSASPDVGRRTKPYAPSPSTTDVTSNSAHVPATRAPTSSTAVPVGPGLVRHVMVLPDQAVVVGRTRGPSRVVLVTQRRITARSTFPVTVVTRNRR